MSGAMNTVVTEITVLPDGAKMTDLDVDCWSLKVCYHNDREYAVMFRSQCLSSDGTWDYEPRPSARTDEWKKTHRFELSQALNLASIHVETVKTSGVTWAEVVKLRAEGKADVPVQ